MKKLIYVVDDNATNLTVAEEVLEQHYRVIALPSASAMFKALEKFRPDLILLDIDMPEMSGFDAMRKLKASDGYAGIPVIFLTGLSDSASEAKGIELGAVDFIMKPFSEPVLLNRIKYHLNIDELIKERTEQLERHTQELERLKNGLVITMADLIESRDKNTGGHVGRTAMYMKVLINAMLARNVYSNEILSWNIDLMVISANLHDLGKLAIPDSILNKPGPLTEEEMDIMRTHSLAGKQIIEKAVCRTGNAELLHNAKLFAEYHHERWDGKGYPNKLKEKEIPLQGRIMAIIDVYDAIVTERPYKKAFTHEKAVGIIMEGADRQFDPNITAVFNEINENISELRAQMEQNNPITFF